MSIAIHDSRKNLQTTTLVKWQRVILLAVLAYEAVGCLLGGTILIIAPDGRLMDMPVSIMRGTFDNFLMPGILLFGLGILNVLAFIAVLRRIANAWIMATLATGGLAIWFWVEIAILQQLHWLHAMWGLPVIPGGVMTILMLPSRRTMIWRASLICGILSSLLYIAINIIVAAQWKGYDSASQTVSELSAVGAPTRMLWIVLSTPYTLLMIAFAYGVWESATGNRLLRITGGLLIAYSALGLLWPFAPMHLREALAAGGATFSDTMHIILGVLTELIFLLALGLASTALGKKFRIYSIASLIILFVFGTLTFLDAPDISTNRPTPHMGVWERINIGVFLLWIVVLAAVLMRREKIQSEGA
ncbi:MAG: DUF998 domain-containing protein [Taibaiella sp.]|jgi:hypothetical protein